MKLANFLFQFFQKSGRIQTVYAKSILFASKHKIKSARKLNVASYIKYKNIEIKQHSHRVTPYTYLGCVLLLDETLSWGT